jgi:poly(3-hydroxybutyrate) depolymerase
MIIRDTLLNCCLKTDRKQQYFLFCPEGKIHGIFVAIHGISLNAHSHAQRFQAYAKQAGYMLIAPLFAKERFPGYMTLESGTNGEMLEEVFQAIVEEAKEACGCSIDKIHLCGYSGGAQFAHRYAYLHPRKLESLIVCSAGCYTYPDSDVIWPYGFKEMVYQADLESFYELPILVCVGEEDVLRTPNLLQNEYVDRTQGRNRLERAIKWHSCINMKSGHASKELVILEGVGHSFEKCMDETPMGEIIFRFIKNLDSRRV